MNFIRKKLSILISLVGLMASSNFVSAEAYWSRTAEVRDGTPLPVAVEHALGFVKTRETLERPIEGMMRSEPPSV